ncbi:PIN domain protein [Myxococcus xanthus DK 1622]|uniref:PIN domain protein n=3 Tax=Myxococcus xanthus TaxID=34 RepID=Q1D9Z3_MYXXD|nr:putative toxin-antitoxin system toxin component, PIN family [Myxococcus xanthus]ABF90658.1 PIN domain protein [Myxococcus xanthus DK 1622]QVW71086.1 putative toxin-antitoxin system toxin component, PIN family [Myxococcus xanthus DZ2]NOJ56138.1 putative toxin-antitoxin system toxin component, PIN family [Myxococcus xanthus]QPM81836.1 putative toxin-antitoxin system toxin component, PIN family [Myxococcus xanthus]UEO02785.1 putative toxin-antitoxin system toxin component, PIN family [Myxococc
MSKVSLTAWGYHVARPRGKGPHGAGTVIPARQEGMMAGLEHLMPFTPLPVVLDTNVVLDLFVFDDPYTRPLAEALAARTLTAWTDADTLAELGYVLASRNFQPGLGAPHRTAAFERYRAQVHMAPSAESVPTPSLPRCRDRDDQKFLSLAARAGAAWLVSKDKRVLSMADRAGLSFAILTPRQAVARLPPRG